MARAHTQVKMPAAACSSATPGNAASASARTAMTRGTRSGVSEISPPTAIAPDRPGVCKFDNETVCSLKERADALMNHQAFEYFRPLKRLKVFVEGAYSQSISLPVAARAAGLERKYLSTYFRKKVGTTFSEWLILFRIREGLKLIESEDRSITEVAYAIGLEVRTFERWFKTLFGCNPRDYRYFVLLKAGFIEERRANDDTLLRPESEEAMKPSVWT